MVMAGGNLARIYDVLVFRRIHYFNNPSYYEKMIENLIKTLDDLDNVLGSNRPPSIKMLPLLNSL